jgi:hypothetical protein
MYLVHVRTSRYVLWNTFKPKKWEETQTSRKLPSEGHHNLCCLPNIIIIILYFYCCATVPIVSRPHKIKVDTHYADVTWDHVTSVEWDHLSYRRSVHIVLTWRGNASRFDQVCSSFDQYAELLSCHRHYLYNYGREMAASFRTFWFLYSRLEGSYRSGLHRTCSINSFSMFTACTTQRNVQRTTHYSHAFTRLTKIWKFLFVSDAP